MSGTTSDGDKGLNPGVQTQGHVLRDPVCRARFPNAFAAVQYTSAFPASTDGNKTWNYQRDGVAHYGMLWDFLEDVKVLPDGASTVASFMTGADYFFKTWQIAEAASARVR